jgi:hypothetical protein
VALTFFPRPRELKEIKYYKICHGSSSSCNCCSASIIALSLSLYSCPPSLSLSLLSFSQHIYTLNVCMCGRLYLVYLILRTWILSNYKGRSCRSLSLIVGWHDERRVLYLDQYPPLLPSLC